jgi:YD repeat-containing protein
MVGNRLSINDNTASYDAKNRTAQLAEPASLGGAQMTYLYDGEDRRVEKLVNNVASTVYVYDAQGQLAAEYAASATAAALCQRPAT